MKYTKRTFRITQENDNKIKSISKKAKKLSKDYKLTGENEVVRFAIDTLKEDEFISKFK